MKLREGVLMIKGTCIFIVQEENQWRGVYRKESKILEIRRHGREELEGRGKAEGTA